MNRPVFGIKQKQIKGKKHSKFYLLIWLNVIVIILGIRSVQAQDTSHSSYSILKPMPRAFMREEMETDRPNITESPFTVEPGHFQYEADLFKHRRETSEDSKQRLSIFNQANLKLGLLPRTALQVIVESYVREVDKEIQSGEKQSAEGFGDVTIRIKQNLLGNYKGNFSLALMPYVKIPTNRYSENQSDEEGVMVPMSLKLPGDWKIGMQVEADRLLDEESKRHHAELLQSLSVSHVLFEKLEVSGETYYTYDLKSHHFNNFLDAALAVELTRDFKIDAGMVYGLQKDAHKDFFFGLAFRY